MKVLVNPIENNIIESVTNSSSIQIAVPFLSYSEVIKVLSSKNISNAINKQIVVKLDDSSSSSYDLAAMKFLLENDFEIRYDNTIHLKLYIFDLDVFISSGNLTNGGLINNFELTVQTTEEESKTKTVFELLWNKNEGNVVTIDYINENWGKYCFLNRKSPKTIETAPLSNHLQVIPAVEKIIEAIFFENIHWSHRLEVIATANKKRSVLFKNLSSSGFNELFFYAPKDHIERKNCLFYEFVYGVEEKLAGTGLREHQFKDVFKDNSFESVLSYIYPQYKNPKYNWDLSNDQEYLKFCKGLFEFKIRNFKEAMPIRLAHYFYPDNFLPIFKLSHLREVCLILGFETNSKSRGEQLYQYNHFLRNRMKDIPLKNYIKSAILYKLIYTIQVKNEIDTNGSVTIQAFIKKQHKEWVRNTMSSGVSLLESLNVK